MRGQNDNFWGAGLYRNGGLRYALLSKAVRTTVFSKTADLSQETKDVRPIIRGYVSAQKGCAVFLINLSKYYGT